MNIDDKLIKIISCPSCTSSLKIKSNLLHCAKCNIKYQVSNNKIYFLNQNKEFTSKNWLDNIKRKIKQNEKLYQFLVNVISPVYCQINNKVKKWLRQFHNNSIIINVGSGITKLDKKIINLDIFDYNNVDIIANATKLPFRNNSIDGIINNAVLEHVAEPNNFVSEFHRVLKKNGKIFIFVPFIQGYHASPHDYQRWTKTGCEKLFKKFDNIKVIPAEGPTSALLWVFQEWFAITFSFYNKYLYRIILILITSITFPIKYLDIILLKHPETKNIAAGFYVIGKK